MTDNLPPAEHSTNEQRTFVLCTLNGAVYLAGFVLIHPTLVVPHFVKAMTGSDTLVGLVSGLIKMGWLLPQLIVGRMVQHMTHKKPVYAVSGVIRVVSWALIAVVILVLGREHPTLGFWLFVLLLFVGSVAGGVGGVPFLDIVGKTISNERRGDLFAWRQFFGCLLGLGSVAVVFVVLGERGPPFPVNFAVLFGAATILIGSGVFLFTRVKEPASEPWDTRGSPLEYIRNGPMAILKDKTFSKLYLYHALSSFSLMAMPFYVLHAKEHLGSASIVGVSLVVTLVTRLVVARLWAKLSSKGRYRRAMSAAAHIRVVIPLLALVIPLVPDRLLFSVAGLGMTVHGVGFAALFALLAASLSADIVANIPYLLAIAPEQIRPTYVGVMNTMLAPLVLVPKILGGVLADWLGGYEYTIVFSAILAALALYAAYRLPERPAASPANYIDSQKQQ